MKPARILVVDDEPGIRQSLCGVLGDDGYLAHAVASGEESLEDLSREPSDLVLLDVWLPGIDGMETLTRIQEIPFADRPVVVMISGHGNIETAVKATKLGAFDFLEKPLSLQKLTVVMKNALEHRRLQLENVRLRGDTESKYRRERHGERTGGARYSCHEPARSRGVCRSQLCSHPRRADRE
jgi:two-component system nitrogen regulation response regulator NtrX